MNVKIKELKQQVQLYNDNIVLNESDIENIRRNISTTSYKEDI